jgi:hypothetical protein
METGPVTFWNISLLVCVNLMLFHDRVAKEHCLRKLLSFQAKH